jgi:hypothetical protein
MLLNGWILHGSLEGPSKDTYFTASRWAFEIWLLISTVVLCLAFYQFTPEGEKTVIEGLGWFLPGAVLANVAYLILRSTGLHAETFYAACFAWAGIWSVSRIIQTTAMSSYKKQPFVYLTFGLWQGWATYLVLLSAFEACGISTDEEDDLGTKYFVLLALLILGGVSAGQVENIGVCAAIAWTLFAIYDRKFHLSFFFCFSLMLNSLSTHRPTHSRVHPPVRLILRRHQFARPHL